MDEEVQVPALSAALDILKAKYIHLVETDSDRLIEQAIELVLNSSVRGVFELERSLREASAFLEDGSIEGPILDKVVEELSQEEEDRLIASYPSVMCAVWKDTRGDSIGGVARRLRAEHLENWARLEYMFLSINCVKNTKIAEYREAQSEATLVTMRAPDWPDLETLQMSYRNPASVP